MSKLKKILIVLIVLVLVLGAGFAGILGLKKLRGMYGQILAGFDTVNHKVSNAYLKTEDLVERLNANIWLSDRDYQFRYDWVNGVAPLIAHAGGGIDGNDYTNTRDAFLYNYDQGYRVFEFDFELTKDGEQFSSHDENRWRRRSGADESMAYNHDNYMSTKLLDKYELMDYRDVIDLMAEYPDVYVVTDTKNTDEASVKYQFSQLVWYAMQKDASVLDRLVVQIYHEEMLNWVMDIYPFKSIIFTLYLAPRTPEEVLEFCRRSGVKFITIPQGSYTPDMAELWDELGITIAVHTVNDTAKAQQFIKDGVDMIYTDFLNPADFSR